MNVRTPKAAITVEMAMAREVEGEPLLTRLLKIRKDQELMKEISERLGFEANNLIGSVAKNRIVILKHVEEEAEPTTVRVLTEKAAQEVRKVLEENKIRDYYIGIGNYYPGVSGFRKSYLESLAAIETGRSIRPKERIYHILDLNPLCAISNKLTLKHKRQLANRKVRPILEDKFLLRSINLFFNSNLNTTLASQNIHIHRNTLIYRLDKIKKITGLDPRKFSDAVRIKLALILLS